MTAEDELKELNSKMDTLIRLTSVYVLEGKTKTEAVGILSGLGFTKSEIASMLRTTTGTVDSMRHRLKGKTKTRSKGGKKSVKNKQENP